MAHGTIACPSFLRPLERKQGLRAHKSFCLEFSQDKHWHGGIPLAWLTMDSFAAPPRQLHSDEVVASCFGKGETHALLVVVELCVVLAQEDVAEDPLLPQVCTVDP